MGKFGILGKAVNDKNTNLIQEKREDLVVVNSNGLFLPEEVDLTGIGTMSDGDLIELIEEDLEAIEQLEAQSFRHAVRAAAAFHELEQRARAQAVAVGEKFKKVQWAHKALDELFKGRIAPRTMRLYQRVAQPENIERAKELETKIQALRAIREAGVEQENFGNAVAKNGITLEEVALIPEEFSLRALDRYIRECDRKKAGKAEKSSEKEVAARIEITVDAPKELINEVELAIRRAISRFAALPKGGTKTTSKDRASMIPGGSRRKLTFRIKEENES